MARAPRPTDEPERLKALQALRILDTAQEERFDRITRVTRRVFDAPVATIGFVDEERLWFKSSSGLSMREAGRDTSLCSWNILDDGLLVVNDLRKDPRWSEMPTVATEPHLRFYAGYPLVSADGRRVGSLCVTDYKARGFGDDERRLLTDLGDWAQTEVLSPRSRGAKLEAAFERERPDTHPRIDGISRFWRRDVVLRILENEVEQSRRERQPVGVMLVAVDRFAEMAAQLGKTRADYLLSDVARSIRFSIRPYDQLGRWQNDQFLVVLPGCDLARTAVAGERIRQARASKRVELSTGPMNVTITVAVASSSDALEAGATTLVSAAERALRLASAGGGNRTRLGSVSK
jgi:diguanylate cyclase (GGDEF)-like protein